MAYRLYEYKFLLKNIIDQLDRRLYSSYFGTEHIKGQLLSDGEQAQHFSHESRKSYASRREFVKAKYAEVKELIRDRWS